MVCVSAKDIRRREWILQNTSFFTLISWCKTRNNNTYCLYYCVSIACSITCRYNNLHSHHASLDSKINVKYSLKIRHKEKKYRTALLFVPCVYIFDYYHEEHVQRHSAKMYKARKNWQAFFSSMKMFRCIRSLHTFIRYIFLYLLCRYFEHNLEMFSQGLSTHKIMFLSINVRAEGMDLN